MAWMTTAWFSVTATSRATARIFEAVTNERGEYRLVGMPPGRYDTKVELAGFSIVVLSDVELLVGQNAEKWIADQAA